MTTHSVNQVRSRQGGSLHGTGRGAGSQTHSKVQVGSRQGDSFKMSVDM